jgi:hypothetical protein
MAIILTTLNNHPVLVDSDNPTVPIFHSYFEELSCVAANAAVIASRRPSHIVNVQADLANISGNDLIDGQTYMTIGKNTIDDGMSSYYLYQASASDTIQDPLVLDGPGSVGRFIMAQRETLDRVEETVTTALPTYSAYGITRLDTSSNTISGVLGSGLYVGQNKRFLIDDITNLGYVNITNHQAGSPTVFTFNSLNNYLSLEWAGSHWVTVASSAFPAVNPTVPEFKGNTNVSIGSVTNSANAQFFELPSGTVYYNLDAVTNGEVEDQSSNNYTGTVSGAIYDANGRVYGCVRFDGVDDFIDVGSWDIDTGVISISAWFKADDFGVMDGRIISKANGVNENDHWWMISTIDSGGTKLRFRVKAGPTWTDTLIGTHTALNTGEWYHVVATFDGTNMGLYLNGVSVGTQVHSNPGALDTDPTVDIYIGNNPPGANRAFDGLIDEVKIFDYVLSQEDISVLAGYSPSNAAPVVDAGSNRTATVDTAITLDGTVTDDGLPSPPNAVTTTWSKVSGPGNITWGDSSVIDTTASFDTVGTYVIQLEADDSELTASDTASVMVSTEVPDVNAHYVSPEGTAGGDGSIGKPWNIETALAHPAAVQPGDTIYLRDGTYVGNQTSSLVGTSGSEIVVRPYPGEHAKLDFYENAQTTVIGLTINGEHVIFRDLEMMSSDPASRINDFVYATQTAYRPGQIYLDANHVHLINNLIHNLSSGPLWQENRGGSGGLMYGNIIFNCGNIFWNSNGTTRATGVAIYLSNKTFLKTLKDNFCFNMLADDYNLYSANSSTTMENVVYIGNISIEPGGGLGQGGTPQSGHQHFTFGGSPPVTENIIVQNNYAYTSNGLANIFWAFGVTDNFTVENNYLYPGFHYWHYTNTNLTANNNVMAGALNGPTVPTVYSSEQNGNTNPARGTLAGTEIFVRPNDYEAGRGHVVIYNWDESGSIDVDLSTILNNGDLYQIHHAYEITGSPRVSGTYFGGTVSIPMYDTTGMELIGDTTTVYGVGGDDDLIIGPPIVLGKEFGAFLVTTHGVVSGHYVATYGTAGGDGSINDPWDLETALAHPAAVQPGDTIYLRDGTYDGGQTSNLVGISGNEITVRSYPGELAKLDLWKPGQSDAERGFRSNGDYVIFRDITFFLSDPASRIDPVSLNRVGKIYIDGSYNKFINNIFHDLGGGILWTEVRGSVGGELNGNIFYNIGWLGESGGNPRGGGVSIYATNQTPTKTIKDNISFNSCRDDISLFSGHAGEPIDDFQIEGNILVNPGGALGQGNPDGLHISIGGLVPVTDVVWANNYSYSSTASSECYWSFRSIASMTMTDNYLACSQQHYWHNTITSLTATNNTLIGSLGGLVPSTFSSQTNGNVHIANIASAAGTEIFVRPNDYEAGRGHIIIFNWDEASSVDVDLSTVLSPGDRYEIKHIYELDDTPRVQGTYAGGSVSIPMQDTTPPPLLGDTSPQQGLSFGSPIILSKEFGAFLVKLQ